MNWTEMLQRGIAETYRATEGLLDLVDDDQLDWKPPTGSNWMTTGQLLRHLTEACGFCCRGFVTGDWGLPEGADMQELPPEQMLPPAETLPTVASVAEARQLLAADRELALRMVQEAGEIRLEEERSRAPWDPAGMDYRLGEHLLGMIQHLATHKAQLFYYLKLQGKAVDTRSLWGM